MSRIVFGIALGVCFAGGFSNLAYATPVTYNFHNITHNNPDDASIGESQLFVKVTAYASDQVLFTFKNIGVSASCISEIYFDDGSLLGIAEIINTPPVVVFEQYASPPDLPGGNAVDFHVTAGFLAEADDPAPKKGVNPSEEVGIVFDLKNGGTFQDVIDELEDGTIRIGVHVTDFSSGGSESFVNNIPEPACLLLLAFGVFPLRRMRRNGNLGKNQ